MPCRRSVFFRKQILKSYRRILIQGELVGQIGSESGPQRAVGPPEPAPVGCRIVQPSQRLKLIQAGSPGGRKILVIITATRPYFGVAEDVAQHVKRITDGEVIGVRDGVLGDEGQILIGGIGVGQTHHGQHVVIDAEIVGEGKVVLLTELGWIIVELPGSTLTVGTIQGSTGRDGAGQIGKLQFIQIA